MSKFTLLFMDLLQGLAGAFPDCRETRVILDWVQRHPSHMQRIRTEWVKTKPNTVERKSDILDRLQVHTKFMAMDGDLQAQNDLCTLLEDLDECCELKLRFNDPNLFDLCVERVGDVQLVRDMQTICLEIPELNERYYTKTNEEIARQMLVMKPLLPTVMQLYKSGALPLGPIIQMVTQFTRKQEGNTGICV